MIFLFLLAALRGSTAVVATPPIPPELYSPLILQKLQTVAQNYSNPASYPQYTAVAPYVDDDEGQWQWFPTDFWTNGFFPASMTLLSERAQSCPSGALISTSDASNILSQARMWSAPLTSLETNTDVGHDVG